ncbi:hypothetical protein VTN77DRAFT_9478 [Rasamsonia byssochlamydoides]|uniref:uncharacterized protein n=1 Tax=Rasamsonia byssochlamydoides TaxID=89139 RepID=UPI0037437B39
MVTRRLSPGRKERNGPRPSLQGAWNDRGSVHRPGAHWLMQVDWWMGLLPRQSWSAWVMNRMIVLHRGSYRVRKSNRKNFHLQGPERARIGQSGRKGDGWVRYDTRRDDASRLVAVCGRTWLEGAGGTPVLGNGSQRHCLQLIAVAGWPLLGAQQTMEADAGDSLAPGRPEDAHAREPA